MNHTEAQKMITQFYNGKLNISKQFVEALEWGMKLWEENNSFSMKVNLYKQKVDSLKNTIKKFDEI